MQQHVPDAAFQASFPAAVVVVKVQQGLRLHGIVGRPAEGVEMPYDGIVLRVRLLQEPQRLLAVSPVLVELPVGKQQGDDGVDQQHVGGAFAQVLRPSGTAS